MTVHVILACHNGQEFIESQIVSILNQSGADVRIYVFDDCSKDKTPEIITTLMTKDSRIRFVPSNNPSGSAFKNYSRAILSDVIDVANEDFLAFCDQDDLWLPNKLATQIAVLRESGAVGCSTSVTAFYSDGREQYINNAGKQTNIDFLFEGGGQGCTYLFVPAVFELLREALRRGETAGLGTVPHDWLLYALCRWNRLPWVILEEPLLRYRQHDANAFGARSSWSGKFRRFTRLYSGDFRDERLRLCAALNIQPNHVANVPAEFLIESRFGKRLKLTVTHLSKFRRSFMDSIIVGTAFILGVA